MTRRNLAARWLLALLAPVALVLAACGDDGTATSTTEQDGGGTDGGSTDDGGSTEGDGGAGASVESCSSVRAPDGAPEITIAAQDFAEARIIGDIYRQCLEAAGFTVSVSVVGGRDVELAAFEGDEVNLAVEYAASMLEELNDNAGEATGDAAETTELLRGYLDDIGLVALEPSDAVDTNSLVVTQETADSLGLTTISDLADHPDLRLGAPSDCPTNPGCIPGLQEVYGIDLSANFVALDAGREDSLEGGAIDVAVLFSTSSAISDRGFVVLEDDQGLFNADNILPVLTTELNEVEGVADLLNAISAALTTENVTAMNARSEIDFEDESEIATSFLEEHELL